ncbi:hypothetical protein [Periweissella beninensis]|uniref:hypothetical protein n=1 Tax=Periweissella beninensis TaxID=504936 RepID=UPI0021A45F91|nr:hypothetical protein [Periweissella beninensis]
MVANKAIVVFCYPKLGTTIYFLSSGFLTATFICTPFLACIVLQKKSYARA